MDAEKVEIKPRFLDKIQEEKKKHKHEVVSDNPKDVVVDVGQSTIASGAAAIVAPVSEGFWDTLSKYKMIIFYSIIFTILICAVIYYFWRAEPEPLKTPTVPPSQQYQAAQQQLAASGGAPQPAPVVAQQPATKPAKKLSPEMLAKIANKAKSNITKLETDPVEAAYIFAQFAKPDGGQSDSVSDTPSKQEEEAYITDEEEEEEPTVLYSQFHISMPVVSMSDFTTGGESQVEEVIEEASEVEQQTIAETRCLFKFKNGRNCGKKTNGKDRCSKHMSM